MQRRPFMRSRRQPKRFPAGDARATTAAIIFGPVCPSRPEYLYHAASTKRPRICRGSRSAKKHGHRSLAYLFLRSIGPILRVGIGWNRHVDCKLDHRHPHIWRRPSFHRTRMYDLGCYCNQQLQCEIHAANGKPNADRTIASQFAQKGYSRQSMPRSSAVSIASTYPASA